jgi:hypothetical protein
MKSLAISAPGFSFFAAMICLPPASPCEAAVLRVVESEGNASVAGQDLADYSGYIRCRGVLKERIAGIQEAIPREASWGMARFDIATTEKTAIPVERLRERLTLEIHRQDDRVLEVSLR